MGLTTDPHDGCLHEILPNGQQKCHLILSEEERARGFIRPVRTKYKHVACGVVTTMAREIAETYARDPGFYGGTFCAFCGTYFSLVVDGEHQFLWDYTGEGVGT